MVLILARAGQDVKAKLIISRYDTSTGEFATIADPVYIGAGTKVDKYDIKFDTMEIYELGNRLLQDYVKRKFSGGVTVSGYASNFDILRLILSLDSKDANGCVSGSFDSTPRLISVAYDIAGTKELIDDVVPTRVSISFKADEPVHVSIDGLFRGVVDSYTGTVDAEAESPPYTFASVSKVVLTDGSNTYVLADRSNPSINIGYAKEVTISVDTGLTYDVGVGSYYPVVIKPEKAKINVDLDLFLIDENVKSIAKSLFGDASSLKKYTLKIFVTPIGEICKDANNNEYEIEFDVDGFMVSDVSTGMSPGEVLELKLSGAGSNLTVKNIPGSEVPSVS